MASNELATALQYDLKPIYLVINNGMFGTIRMHQERDYPGREVATDLRNPDFAAYAQSFGAFGEIVERSEDFAAALDRALAADTVAVLELRTDPEAINTRAALKALPPLVKGYLRVGAFVGDGAVIDHQFGTTDIFVVMPVEAINTRYFAHFGSPDALNAPAAPGFGPLN